MASSISPSSALPAPKKKREQWADTAKGLSIFGVVLLHSVHYVSGSNHTFWGTLSDYLDPLRMPIFFLVAGYFSQRILTSSLSNVWRRRIWFLLVPFVCYTTIHVAIWIWFRGWPSENRIYYVLLTGSPGLWFLHALIIYSLFAWCMRKFAPMWSFALCLVLCLVGAFAGMLTKPGVLAELRYLPIFLVGLYYRPIFSWIAEHSTKPIVILIAFSSFALVEYQIYDPIRVVVNQKQLGPDLSFAFLMLTIARAIVALGFAIVLSVWLSRTPIIGKLLSRLGQNSITVYITHEAVIILVIASFVPWLVAAHPSLNFLLDPYLLTPLSLLVCAVFGYLFYLIAKVPYIGWTIKPPALRVDKKSKLAELEPVAVPVRV